MIRFQLKLIPVTDDLGADELKVINESNNVATKAFEHLKKILGKRKCRKHPSSPNKIRVIATKGAGPEVMMMAYCCKKFVATLK
jgi:hypothetical protein